MRLDKILANKNFGSRKDVKKAISSGNVSVDGEIIVDVSYNINEGSVISIDGLEFVHSIYEYVVLNKPVGYVCANKDNVHETVFDLLPDMYRKDFHVVGRLDVDTTGLVLITNDGEFTHNVISPNNKVGKKYLVTLEDKIEANYENDFKNGVVIDDYMCMSALFEKIDDYNCYLTIFEGKFHQVKKMFMSLGNKVVALHRKSIGELNIDSTEEGDYFLINGDEVRKLCLKKG